MSAKVHVIDGWERGDVLTAVSLNALEARVAALRQRAAHTFAGRRIHLREPEAFRFGFQVCVLCGTVLVRQGLIDWGCGEFERVGAAVEGEPGRAEWTPVGAFEAGKVVWLQMQKGESRVYLDDFSEQEVSSALRRRLAVLQRLEDGGMRLLQLTGGVMTPGLIRGAAGSPNYWQGHYDGSYEVRAEDDARMSDGWTSAGLFDWGVNSEGKPWKMELSYSVGEPGRGYGVYDLRGRPGRPLRVFTGLIQR